MIQHRTHGTRLSMLAVVLLASAVTVACQESSPSAGTAEPIDTAAGLSGQAAADLDRLSDVETAVTKVLDTQVEAWNDADMEGFLAPYWRDPGLTFYSGGSVVRGYEVFAARFRERYTGVDSAGMGYLDFRDLEIVALGSEAALARGQWHLEREGVEPIGGLFTLILRRLPAEGWRIVHDQTSTFEEPPPSDDEPMAA